ncbi:MAG TPA: MerR family transcriptional regulator [Candidatus Limnocylindria bacterium]|nr:MerR family transcriptional regulator [Candidatus Limnocylindria bacterium]
MYTISEAASRAGVTTDVLRAWERRYRIVEPRRTPSGYRQYDDAAIRRVRAMRRMVEDGWAPSAAAESLRDVVDADLPDAEPQPGESPGTADVDDLRDRFVRAAADMEPAALQAVLDEMGARASFEPMVDRYLFPALHALGDAWQAGTVSVAAEHAASAAVGRWIGAAYDAAGTNRPAARPILVGLPAGARHELGALAFATAARRAGLAVHYIGADVPAADWLRAARATMASAAVIGVPTTSDASAARTVIASLRRSMPDLLVTLGGEGARGMPRQSVLPARLPEAVRDLEARLAHRTS